MWPAPLKFISDLNPEARTLLERALITANKDREKAILKDTVNSFPSSPVHSDSGAANDISEVHVCVQDFCIFSIVNQYILKKYLLQFIQNFDCNLSLNRQVILIYALYALRRSARLWSRTVATRCAHNAC